MSVRLVARSIWRNPGNRGKRLRRTIDAIVWQLQKRTVRSSRILRLANGTCYRAHPDCVVSSALLYAEWPDYNELTFLRKKLRHGDVILDVGAHTGHISLLLIDVVGASNVFAFEPTPISHQRLVENWQLNGWATDRLLQVAVGARAGSVYVPDVDRPLTTNRVACVAHRDDAVEVSLVHLDALRHLWHGRHIGLLKIDVEGYEMDVFRGSRELLQQERPRFIMFESLTDTLDSNIHALLTDCAYVVFQLDAGGRPDFSALTAQNLFAIPCECRDLVGC